MDIRLSSKKGMVFGDLIINNTNSVYLTDVKMDASPAMRYFEFDVPKRNGSSYYDNKYEDQVIKVTIAIKGKNIIERKAIQRGILSRIIGKESNLSFLDEPNLFYKAKCYDSMSVKDDRLFSMIDIEFIASYCKYEFIGDANDIITADANFTTAERDPITNTQEWMNINSLTYKMIENTGNHESETFIVITANTACNKIIMDNGINSFTLSNLSSGEVIFIDSEKMIVYKKNGEQKISAMTSFSGKFLKVPIGESMITISGTSFNVNIDFKYRNTYIV